MTNSGADDIFAIGAELSEAGEARQVRSHFGRLTITSRTARWQDGQPVDVTVEEFKLVPTAEQLLEYVFEVDTKEIDPTLWDFSPRKLRVKSVDWYKTFVPALKKLLGDDAVRKLGTLQGRYVEVQDAPQLPPKKGSEKHLNPATGEPYSTVKIVRVFEDKVECLKAYTDRWGEPGSRKGADGASGTGASAPASLPDLPGLTPEMQEKGWDTASWSAEVRNAVAAGKTAEQIATEYDVPIESARQAVAMAQMAVAAG